MKQDKLKPIDYVVLGIAKGISAMIKEKIPDKNPELWPDRGILEFHGMVADYDILKVLNEDSKSEISINKIGESLGRLMNKGYLRRSLGVVCGFYEPKRNIKKYLEEL